MDLSQTGQLVRSASQRPVLAYSPHPLMPARDRALEYAHFLPGETLAAYLSRTGIAPRIARRHVVLSIDGRRLPRSLWHVCRPKPGTLINIQALAGDDGGDDSKMLRTVAMIALVAAAPWLAGPAGLGFAAGSTAAAIAGGAIIAVGSMALNELLPLPGPPKTDAQKDSPTYALAGGSNRARLYEPMPKICGKQRVFPDLGAKFYTEFIGEDQFLNGVFDLGYNKLVLSDHRIGQTPIESFAGVELEESGTDGKLRLFPGNVDSQAGAGLTAAAGWVSRTSSPNATALAVEITGALFQQNKKGEIVDHLVVIEINYRLVGAPAWSTVQLGDDSLPARAIPQTADSGSPEWEVVDDWNDLIRLSVIEWNIQNADPLPAGQLRIRSGKRAPLRRTYKWNVAPGQYEVRVQRVSADDTDPKKVSEITWSQLRTYQPETTDYTGRKRVGLRIRASGQLSGLIEEYNCIASACCQVWDGAAWSLKETSNPGFWVLDAARGATDGGGRRVWGAGLPDSRIDIENLKAFAAWCAASRLTFNGVFDTQLSVFEMLSQIALCGRGTISRASGKLGVVWDAPDQPVQAIFSMANIVLDSFEVAYATGDLADEVALTFVNPELDWQRDTVRAQVPGGANPPLRTRNIHLFGCTNRDMAGRMANLYAAANAYRAKRYKWTTDWDGMPASRGDVVKLSHDLTAYDYSGRLIEGSTAASLKLPRKVPLDPAGGFVTIVKPDGSFSTHAVAGRAGETDTLALVAPLGFNPGADPNHPPYDYRWLFGTSSSPGKTVKIDSWKPKGYNKVELTAVEETAEYYAAETNPVTYAPPTRLFGTVQIDDLALTEDGVRAANGYLVEVTATWTPGGDYSHAEVRFAVGNGPLELKEVTRGHSARITVSDFVDLTVEVTAYSTLGRLGRTAKKTLTQTINYAAKSPPSDITSFALNGSTFVFPAAPEVDVVGYRIRFHYGENRSIADANNLQEGLISSSPAFFETLPAGVVTFMITAVDAAGLESVTPAVIVKDLGEPATENVVETIDFAAASWPGTVTGGAEVGPDLEANSLTEFYGPDDSPFYGADADDFYEAEVFDTMVYETEIFYFSADWIGSDMVLSHTIEGQPVKLEYRRTNEEPFYGADADAFYGPDAEAFYGADGQYQPWTGTVTFEGGDYQLRVTTGGSPVQGAIRDLAVVIDVPDVVDEIEGVAIAPGGTRVPLTKDFTAIKTAQFTLEADGGAAVSARILDKDPELGILIETVDGAGVSVAGTGDLTVKGR